MGRVLALWVRSNGVALELGAALRTVRLAFRNDDARQWRLGTSKQLH